MKKSHAGFWVGGAVFLIAAVYSIVLFLVKPDFDIASWVLYGATMIAFLLMGMQIIAAARGGSGIAMNSAQGIITAIYFGVQLIFGGVICMRFQDLPLTPVIVCEIILLAAYLAFAFLMFAAQSSSTAQDQNDRRTVQKMRLLESDVQGLAEEAADPEIKKALQKLAEAIHFSDVASLPALDDVEGRIAQNIAILQDELKDENADPLGRIETLHRLLKERNRTAAILKGQN